MGRDFPDPDRARSNLGGWALPCAIACLVLGAGALLSPALQGGKPPGQALFFGVWRTRYVALALALTWTAGVLLLGMRSRRAATGLVVSSVVLGCSLLVLEVSGRVLEVDWNGLLAGGGKLTLGHEAVPHLEVEGVAQQDIAFSCGMREFERVSYRFRSDRRGFRNEVDRDEADLYLLGDSFIVAGLVPAEDLVGSRLERQLGRPVMNVALSGICPQDERDLLLSSGLPLAGRTVLHFIFEGNDLEGSAKYDERRVPDPGAETGASHSLVTALVVHLQRLSERWVSGELCSIGLLDGEPYLFGWVRSSFEGYEDQCQVVADTLLELREEVTRQGGRYAVVLIPAKIRVLGPLCSWPEDSTLSGFEEHVGPLRDFMPGWAAEHGVPYLDLTDTLVRSVEEGQVPWFPADTHWNSRGHQVVAEALRAWLPTIQE
jgi:hypothetical protein